MRWGKWKLQILYYLVNILIGDIRNLFLVIYGEQIDAGVVRLHSDNKRNNSHPAALIFPFAFYGKSNLVFSPTQINAYIGIVNQLMLQCIDIVCQRVVMFGQSFGLGV